MLMDATQIKNYLPTLADWWEKRRKKKQNQLPKHLRPPEIWPIWIQIALNAGLIVMLCNLMIDRDDYLTEAGPAIAMIVAFLFLIFTMIEAVRYRRHYENTRGTRLAKINFVLMILAFLSWTGSIVVFLP
jgi:hypothetical protein